LNKAFQRLIYLLSDHNRIKVLQESPWIITKTSGKQCLTEAYNFLTEKQKTIVDAKVNTCKIAISKQTKPVAKKLSPASAANNDSPRSP